MFSTPLICSSSGAATVSAMIFGLAPGYCARTTTDGGTTSGYSEIGSMKIEIRPATKMMIDKTAAKIGLSTKKREIFIVGVPYYLEVEAEAVATLASLAAGLTSGAAGSKSIATICGV